MCALPTQETPKLVGSGQTDSGRILLDSVFQFACARQPVRLRAKPFYRYIRHAKFSRGNIHRACNDGVETNFI